MNTPKVDKRAWISDVVNSFYSVAREDILIGYHFRNIDDFSQHIPRIITFWELQLLGKSSNSIKKPFDILNAHLPLGIKKGELGRWIILFRKSLEIELEKKPEMKELKDQWDERLDHFKNIFSRSFGL